MPNRTKQRRSGGLTLLLYQRTLHPELFKIFANEQVSRRAYEADVWLVEGGHVITFTAGKHTLTEVILMGPGEMTAPGGNIRYMISTQEEQLTQTLYEATKSEIREYALKRELMMADIPAAGERGESLGVLDIERRSHELLVQSFHLFDDTQLVIKTQAIIEVAKNTD